MTPYHLKNGSNNMNFWNLLEGKSFITTPKVKKPEPELFTYVIFIIIKQAENIIRNFDFSIYTNGCYLVHDKWLQSPFNDSTTISHYCGLPKAHYTLDIINYTFRTII